MALSSSWISILYYIILNTLIHILIISYYTKNVNFNIFLKICKKCLTKKNLYDIFKIRKGKINMKQKILNLILLIILFNFVLLGGVTGGLLNYIIIIGITTIFCILFGLLGGFDEE